METSYRFRIWGIPYIIMLLGLLLSSYFINASHRIWMPDLLFSKAVFRQLFLMTIPLLGCYVYMVSYAYCRVENYYRKRDIPYGKGHKVIGAILVSATLLLVHICIVSMLVSVSTEGQRSVFNTAYFRKDFPYLAMIVLGYTLIAFFWVKARFVYLLAEEPKEVLRIEKVFDYWESWQKYKAPHSLLSYFREKFPSPDPGYIRVYDVVLLESVNTSCVAHLASGETVVFHCSYNELRQGIVDKWFVMLKSRYYVNMLYVDLLKTHKGHVILDQEVEKVLGYALGMDKLSNFLTVNRYFQGRLQEFIDRKDMLPSENFMKPVCDMVKT